MDLMYTAQKDEFNKTQFAFEFASLPDPTDSVVDGDDDLGTVDGNNPN